MLELGVQAEPAASEAPEVAEPDERQRVAEVLGQVLGAPKRPAQLSYSAPTVDGEGGVTRSSGPSAGDGAGTAYGNVSRNAPCPCGSGRKFKRCHGSPDAR
ncbi:MAG TPA: SEC-C domain-containing protein [Mycobacteriales bacterium]|nr:SEC-C domain-containing protein [Mycobacteriales bacterium]